MYTYIYMCVLIRCGNPARDLIFRRFRATSQQHLMNVFQSTWPVVGTWDVLFTWLQWWARPLEVLLWWCISLPKKKLGLHISIFVHLIHLYTCPLKWLVCLGDIHVFWLSAFGWRSAPFWRFFPSLQTVFPLVFHLFHWFSISLLFPHLFMVCPIFSMFVSSFLPES